MTDHGPNCYWCNHPDKPEHDCPNKPVATEPDPQPEALIRVETDRWGDHYDPDRIFMSVSEDTARLLIRALTEALENR